MMIFLCFDDCYMMIDDDDDDDIDDDTVQVLWCSISVE